jgi:hypothetical protein
MGPNWPTQLLRSFVLCGLLIAGGNSGVQAEPQALPPPTQPSPMQPSPMQPGIAVPDPPAAATGDTNADEGSTAGTDGPGHAQLPGAPTEANAEPLFDLSLLPFPARKMRELLLEAVKSGDIEKLRPFVGTGEDKTLFSFGGLDGDPVDFLKSMSGDGEGYEILAILQDVLDAGFVHLEKGTENEIFVWPYFYAVPLEKLTPQQRVELYRLVTHGDFEDMLSFGSYNFYRVGITPQGRWQFFVAGD